MIFHRAGTQNGIERPAIGNFMSTSPKKHRLSLRWVESVGDNEETKAQTNKQTNKHKQPNTQTKTNTQNTSPRRHTLFLRQVESVFYAQWQIKDTISRYFFASKLKKWNQFCVQAFRQGATLSAGGLCLGWRNSGLLPFQWLTYNEVNKP